MLRSMIYNELSLDKFSPDQIEAFWKLVPQPVVGCWPWQGAGMKSHGLHYGVWYSVHQAYRPHRVAYLFTHGTIDNSLTIDHLCLNKLCCNPAHLEQVTQSENTKRRYTHPLRLYPLTCKYGHIKIFGHVRCRRCAVIVIARSQAKKPEKYAAFKRESARRRRASKSIHP